MTFSVVTPSFNQPAWLNRAVASVRDQGTGGLGIEHIVQDAGTKNLAEFFPQPEVVEQNYRLLVISEKDEGMYDAINRGLKKTKGELCSYLNCDEQYLPRTLDRVANFFAKNPEVDVVFGDAILINPAGEPLSYRRAVLPDRLHTRLVHLNVLTCATFFRHSVVKRGFLFDPRWKIIGDAAWIDSMLEAKLRMAVIHEPLSVFTFTGANLSEGGRSTAEQKKWVPRRGLTKVWRLLAILKHRWEKWRAGAYIRRDLDYKIFTDEQTDERSTFQAKGVGYSWPKS